MVKRLVKAGIALMLVAAVYFVWYFCGEPSLTQGQGQVQSVLVTRIDTQNDYAETQVLLEDTREFADILQALQSGIPITTRHPDDHALQCDFDGKLQINYKNGACDLFWVMGSGAYRMLDMGGSKEPQGFVEIGNQQILETLYAAVGLVKQS